MPTIFETLDAIEKGKQSGKYGNGKDAQSATVSDLIAKNQSKNETNFAASVGTTKPTALEKQTATKEDNFKSAAKASSKVKTTVTPDVKQTVIDVQPASESAEKIKSVISEHSEEALTALGNSVGFEILSDVDFFNALQQKFTQSTQNRANNKPLPTEQAKSSQPYYVFPFGEFVLLNSGDASSNNGSSNRSETGISKTTFGSTFTPPSTHQVNLPEVDLNPSISGLLGDVKTTLPMGALDDTVTLDAFSDAVDGMGIDDFTRLSGHLDDVLEGFNDCPQLPSIFGGKLFDLSVVLSALLDFLNFGFNLDCFDDILNQLDNYSLDGLLQSAVSIGSVTNVNNLVSKIGIENIKDPVQLATDVVGNLGSNLENFASFDEQVTALTTNLQVNEEDIFGSSSTPIIDLNKTLSFSDDRITARVFTPEKVDFVKSLPFSF